MILASLIPGSFFAGFRPDSMWVLWVMGAMAIAVLVYGADRLVAGAVRLAKTMGLPTVVIGATVVSLGTTSPEACVSVNAALHGEPGLALGNGVGSIICDTALIFGLCCLISRVPKNRYVLSRQGWMQFGSGVLLIVIVAALLWYAVSFGGLDVETWLGGSDGTATSSSAPATAATATVATSGVFMPRWIGIGLLGLLATYMYLSVRWSRGHAEAVQHLDEIEEIQVDTAHTWRAAGVSVLMVLAGLVMVVGGSEMLIGSVKQICLYYKVPEEVLAVTLVAFGTSLPELVTAVTAVARGHGGLMVGNIIGADVLNVLFVIGASATAVPLEVKPMFFTLYLPVMLAALVLFRVFIFLPGDRFSRWQGIPLLGLYAGFIYLTIRQGVR